MATSFQSPTGSSAVLSAADFEPDEQWKSRLKIDTENNLRSMADEAKQNLHDTLKKTPVSALERERLTEEHLATMKNIRYLAEEQFRIALERERQERRWVPGQTTDREWLGTMLKEQPVIADKIERERKNKAASVSASLGSYKPPSALETKYFERPRPSPTMNELDSVPESVCPVTGAQDNIRRESLLRKASISTRQLPEFWLPSITPEEDAQMSRTFGIARHGNTAATTSSHRLPPVLKIPSDNPSHTVPNGYARSSGSSRSHPPPLSTSRLITPKKTLTVNYGGFQSRPSPPAQSGPSRPPDEARNKGLNDDDRREYDQRQMCQREDSVSLRRWDEEVARREQELRRREEDARREEDQAKRRQEEADRRELEIQRMEEARKKEEETRRKEDEIQRKEMLARKKEEEVRRQEAQARERAEGLRRQEEEVARRLEEEEKRVALEISRKSMEAKRKEDEVKRKEEDARLKEEAVRAIEEEIQRKEEELLRREEELLRREAEAIRRSDDKQKVQQDEFRKREEEIRRQRAEEKKKQEKYKWESWGYYPPETSRPTPPPQMATSHSQSSSSSTGPWPIPNRSDRSMPGPSPPTDRSSFGSTSTSRSSAAWTSSTRPSSTVSSHPPSTPKPPTPSAQQNAKAASGPPLTPLSEAEFHRRRAEQAQQREEQFRREQDKLEQERLLKAGEASRKQDTIKLFEHHRGQWAKLQMSGVLMWDNFPWPVFKRSSGPDDITTPNITAYMLSSLHLIDMSLRHRVKENIRRWHHDRFEIWLLPKVKESDRRSVREAASTVARTLYYLLRSGQQDPDVSTASSHIIMLKPPILLAQQDNAPSHPAHIPIPEVKVYRSEVEKARQSEERFCLEPDKLEQEEKTLKEKQLAREGVCDNIKPHSQTELLPDIPTSPSPESTATTEEAIQELPDSVSDSLEDLTNELQGRSSFPAASGGFGDIWKCILVRANENVDVAVKTIRAFETDNKESMQKNARRVRRELKVWGRLKHHSILPLWGVVNDFGPYPAMICPWADNGALTGFLERQQDKLSSLDKFSLLNDIALGLQYLHSKSVVHGDLTGSNVLIYANGRACLADFGLSTVMLEFVGTSYFTSSIRGNVRWVAAELCEASEDEEVSLSPECDIYSFGSITLQVLTCRVPYYNVKKDFTVMGQIMKGLKPKPPKESKIAPGHWEFIQRCWLPRANRPSVAEVVTFIACEQQALSP